MIIFGRYTWVIAAPFRGTLEFGRAVVFNVDCRIMDAKGISFYFVLPPSAFDQASFCWLIELDNTLPSLTIPVEPGASPNRAWSASKEIQSLRSYSKKLVSS